MTPKRRDKGEQVKTGKQRGRNSEDNEKEKQKEGRDSGPANARATSVPVA